MIRRNPDDIDPHDNSGMFRKSDPETSKRAAESVEPKRSAIQQAVIDAYVEHGPMTARVCERLPQFEGYSPSTIRKRISELAKDDVLAEDGTSKACGKTPATVYRIQKVGE